MVMSADPRNEMIALDSSRGRTVLATVILGSAGVGADAASGVNDAVARTAGLLAVAAIPSLVGLTGDALSDPELLGPGFERAMWMSAIVVASGGAVAFFFLAAEVSTTDLSIDGCQQHPCPVDGSLSSIRTGLASAER